MAQVVIILGSESDQKIVKESQMVDLFEAVGISYEVAIISAHRNLQELTNYCVKTQEEGAQVYIGVAGMAAALPGAIASHIRWRPVIGVPLSSDILQGLDALLSMVRMPSGIPVAVPGIDKSGLRNAALLACQIIALTNPSVEEQLRVYIVQREKEAQFNIQIRR